MADQIVNVNSGFYDSVNNDRLYSAEQMNRPYKRVITNGVFATQTGTASTDLQVVSANNGMNIKCKAGEGMFADKWFENPSDITFSVPSNGNVVPRRDSVIIQVDKRQSGRKASVVYREGTPASSPQPPAIGTVTNVIEYRIANIYVAPGATYIGNDAIVDLRGSSECPWITSLVKQVDTSQLYNQWNAAYQAYYTAETERFNAFMQQLTEEISVNTSIAMYESHYSVVAETNSIPINIANYNKNTDVLIVWVNGWRATPGTQYVINQAGTHITLTNTLKADNTVNFLVLHSMLAGDASTVAQDIAAINTALAALNTDTGWINFILESGATAFDANSTPGCRKFGNRVSIRGAIKGFDYVGSAICTLPATMRPAQAHLFTSAAISNSGIAGTVVFEVGTNGVVKIVAKSATLSNTSKLSIATNFIVG